MENKLIMLCCILSFIIGMYTTVMITKDRGCTVTYSKGKEVHVMVGKWQFGIGKGKEIWVH